MKTSYSDAITKHLVNEFAAKHARNNGITLPKLEVSTESKARILNAATTLPLKQN